MITNRRFKYFIITILVLTFAFQGVTSFASESTITDASESIILDEPELIIPDEYELIAENNNFILYANTLDSNIAVLDKENMYVWYSNPLNAEEDPNAVGINRMRLQSQLIITVKDESGREYTELSQVASVNRDGLSASKIENGIRFDYSFPREAIIIPVLYKLAEDHLVAEILLSEVEENDEYLIRTIQFLPFFGAGGLDDTGYMMVPDGSGALINFNNNKNMYSRYRQPVYGQDPTKEQLIRRTKNETIRMPVFGIKNNDNAFLAVISEGEGVASITAAVSKMGSSYNNVHTTLDYRMTDSIYLRDKDWLSESYLRVDSKAPVNLDVYQIRFYLLQGENANYTGMAKQYREYLIKEKGLEKRHHQSSLYIDAIGAVRNKRSFLGIPIQYTTPLTTFKQTEELVKELKERGVDNLTLRYSGWLTGGLENQKLSLNARAERKLGGNKAFENLASYLSNLDIDFYPSFDFMNFRKSGNGVSRITDTIRSVTNMNALQYFYRVSSYLINPDIKPFYLLSPNKFIDVAVRFMKAFSRFDIGSISLHTAGNQIYSDHSNDGIDRGAGVGLWEDTLSAYKKESTSIIVENGNAYAIPYSDHIINVPAYSSNYDIFDRTIPFYQMVLHGYIPYTTPPMNHESRPDIMFLKALETGSNLFYTATAVDTSILTGTRYDYMYNTYYERWIDNAVDMYTEISKIASEVYNQTIISHERLQKGVYKTVFENGVGVIVNYNDDLVNVQGYEIDACDYIKTGGK